MVSGGKDTVPLLQACVVPAQLPWQHACLMRFAPQTLLLPVNVGSAWLTWHLRYT